MPESDHEPEIIAPEELLADMPLPSDAKTFFLGGLFVLAMLTAVYVASEIVLPMIFAVMFDLTAARLAGPRKIPRPSCRVVYCSRSFLVISAGSFQN